MHPSSYCPLCPCRRSGCVLARLHLRAFAQLLSNKKLEDWMYTGGQANFRTDPLDAHEGALRPTVA